MRGKQKYNYMRLIAIVHGKSERYLCEYLKSNLRLHMGIAADKRGEKSIQINSLLNYLNNSIFSNPNRFFTTYPVERMKKNKINNFNIFTIMDTDDCSDDQTQKYIDTTMFCNHWLYEYVVPIYNMGNLENVLRRSQWPCVVDKKDYCKIFPVNRESSDIEQVRQFLYALKNVQSISNLHLFIQKCIEQYEDI